MAQKPLESDPRFPSGPWTGYFLQKQLPGRHMMELTLAFADGVMSGEGRDLVGTFNIQGKYNLADGRCHWTKRYVDKHDVLYHGFNEGKGIWGKWEIPGSAYYEPVTGGFHIWPKDWPAASTSHLTAQEELPISAEPETPAKELIADPVASRH